jgi:hypothetical protein
LRASGLKKLEAFSLEHFQQKCEAVLRPEMRKNKDLEQFSVSRKH